MTELKKFLKVLALAVFFQVFTQLRGILLAPLIIKLSGVSQFGEYVLLGYSATFIAAISSFGTNYHYRLSLPKIKNTFEQGKIFIPQFLFRIVILSLFCTLIFIFENNLKKYFLLSEFNINYFILLIFGLLIYEQVTDFFKYTDNLDKFNYLNVAPIYFYVILTYFYGVYYNYLNINILLKIQALSYLLICLPILIYKVLIKINIFIAKKDWQIFFSNYRMGFPLVVGFIIDFLVANSDRFLIGHYLSSSAVGQYQVAYQLAVLLAFIPQIICIILPAKLLNLISSGEIKLAEEIVDLSLNIIFMIGFPFVLGAAFIGPSLISIFADRDTAIKTIWVLPIVSISMIFYGLFLVIYQIAFVKIENYKFQLINAISLAINFLINIIFLPIYPGLTVPALSTLTSYLFASILIYVIFERKWNFNINFYKILMYVLSTFVMTIFVYYLGYEPGLLINKKFIYIIMDVLKSIFIYFLVLYTFSEFFKKNQFKIF
jgi:O-antigen/teichoic acid export membrane protein